MLRNRRRSALPLAPAAFRAPQPPLPYLPDPYHFQSLTLAKDTGADSLNPYAGQRCILRGEGGGVTNYGASASRRPGTSTLSPSSSALAQRRIRIPFGFTTSLFGIYKPFAIRAYTGGCFFFPRSRPKLKVFNLHWTNGPIFHSGSPLSTFHSQNCVIMQRGGNQLRRLRWADSDRLRWLAFFCS
jgi:hypothetical protein